MATALDRGELMQALEQLHQQLAADPIFADGDQGSVETMRERLQTAPSSYEELLGATLADGGAHLYGWLRVVASVFRAKSLRQTLHEGAMVVDREEVLFHASDLRIRGDLLLGDRASVLVAGDLVVDGNFIGAEWDNSILGVGGALTVGNLMTQGDLLVADRITVKDVAYLHGDRVARAPAVRARVLIENDRSDLFGSVEAKERVADVIADGTPTLARVCALVSMKQPPDTVDGFEDRLRRRFVAKIPP